jgi:4-oxalocrotonate tautomerase
MPYIHVTIAKGRTVEERKALMAAIAKVTHETIGAPLPTVRVWITECEVADMSIAGVPLDEVRAQRAAGDNSL